MTFKNISISNYNVRGLSDNLKKEQLCKDLKFYNVDLCCVQETKISEGFDSKIRDYRIICQKTSQKDYGNGFLIHKKLEQHIHKVWSLNDRISILEIQMKPQYTSTHNGKAKITINKKEDRYTSTLKGSKLKITKNSEKYLLKIINVYAPHSEITNKNPEITIKFIQ